MSEYPSYLIHYGIEGQKWGVRRFQNEDGTYTSEGLERRKRMLNDGSSESETRHLLKQGRVHAAYNRDLASYQKKSGERFDAHTERLIEAKKSGKEISQRDIDRAINLGTNFRKADYIAKNPDAYYKIKDAYRAARNSNIRKAVIMAAMTYGVGFGFARFRHVDVDASMKRAYNDVFEKARNETIADLEKHGISKPSQNNGLSKAGNMARIYAQTNRNIPLQNKIEKEHPGSIKRRT